MLGFAQIKSSEVRGTGGRGGGGWERRCALPGAMATKSMGGVRVEKVCSVADTN